jgi:fructan beta-fructosidase
MKRLLLVTAAAAGVLAASATLYHELWRLQYHFSPARTWTNDPNGLVWYKGEFHLFYQNNPFGDKWGHMSWGHAVSKDLLHWQELPVAIPEENGIMIFSGSAVVDANNASGLCQSTDPHDPSCLVAIYTGHTSTLQTQNIAVSNDRGRTWTKYKGNPVLDLQMKDFRDPKVSWYAPTRKWVMAVSLPNEHKIRFYSSKNLRQWTLLSDFGPAGATGGQWECPDLFEMSAAQKTEARKWVLIVNVNPGGVQGGSAVQYFVGSFDGTTFHNDNPAGTTLWADWGKDFYAAVTYYDSPPGDISKYLIGWFSNWEYANDEPTVPQRGAMAIPRELMLRGTPAGIRLMQRPVSSLATLHGTELGMHDRDIASANQDIIAKGFHGHQMEIVATFEPGSAKDYGLLVHKGATEKTVVGVTSDGHLYVDRTQSGKSDFSKKFPGRQTAPLRLGKLVTLHILLDTSSVEVFAGDGERVISDRVFPAPESDGIQLFSNGGAAKVAALRMWKINSVWP